MQIVYTRSWFEYVIQAILQHRFNLWWNLTVFSEIAMYEYFLPSKSMWFVSLDREGLNSD